MRRSLAGAAVVLASLLGLFGAVAPARASVTTTLPPDLVGTVTAEDWSLVTEWLDSGDLFSDPPGATGQQVLGVEQVAASEVACAGCPAADVEAAQEVVTAIRAAWVDRPPVNRPMFRNERYAVSTGDTGSEAAWYNRQMAKTMQSRQALRQGLSDAQAASARANYEQYALRLAEEAETAHKAQVARYVARTIAQWAPDIAEGAFSGPGFFASAAEFAAATAGQVLADHVADIYLPLLLEASGQYDNVSISGGLMTIEQVGIDPGSIDCANGDKPSGWPTDADGFPECSLQPFFLGLDTSGSYGLVGRPALNADDCAAIEAGFTTADGTYANAEARAIAEYTDSHPGSSLLPAEANPCRAADFVADNTAMLEGLDQVANPNGGKVEWEDDCGGAYVTPAGVLARCERVLLSVGAFTSTEGITIATPPAGALIQEVVVPPGVPATWEPPGPVTVAPPVGDYIDHVIDPIYYPYDPAADSEPSGLPLAPAPQPYVFPGTEDAPVPVSDPDPVTTPGPGPNPIPEPGGTPGLGGVPSPPPDSGYDPGEEGGGNTGPPVAGACDGYIVGHFDFEPLRRLDFGDKFPWGFLTFAKTVQGEFTGVPTAPKFEFHFGSGLIGSHDYLVDLGDSRFQFDAYMSTIRSILAFVMWVGAVWYLASMFLGFHAAGDPASAVDDGMDHIF
jgi:hypothetical protein